MKRLIVLAIALSIAGLATADGLRLPAPPAAALRPGSPGGGVTVTLNPIHARTHCSDTDIFQTSSGPGILFPSDTIPHTHNGVGENIPDPNILAHADIVWELIGAFTPGNTNVAGEGYVGFFDFGDYPLGGGQWLRSVPLSDCVAVLRYELPEGFEDVTSAQLEINGFNGSLWAILGVQICRTANPQVPWDADGDGIIQQPSPGGCIVSGRDFTDFNFTDTHDMLVNEAFEAHSAHLANGINAAHLDFFSQAGPFTETITLGPDIVAYVQSGGNEGIVDLIVRNLDPRGVASEGPAGSAALAGGYPANFLIIEDRGDFGFLAGGNWSTDLVLGF